MPGSVAEFISLLELEQVSLDEFIAPGADPRSGMLQRVFGGQVLAQALSAGYRTVADGRVAHSLGAYFLRAGLFDVPISYQVERTRDGGNFSTRRVLASQQGKPIFSMVASFHTDEPGLDHSDVMPADVPAPEDCPPLSEVLGARGGRAAAAWQREWGVIETRFASDTTDVGSSTRRDAEMKVWVRASSPLPEALWVHQAMLAYASDLTLLAVSTVPHPVEFAGPKMQVASVNHSMWFHRPVRADQWLLYDQVSPSASSGLGFSFGRMFADGALAASCAQEGLIRMLS